MSPGRMRHVVSSFLLFLSSVALAACKSGPAPAGLTAGAASSDDRAFAALRDRFVDEHHEQYPNEAVDLGLHRYDGRLPDWSAPAIEARLAWLRASRGALEAVPAAGLSPVARAERAALLNEISASLFPIEATRDPWRNPIFYLFRGLNLNSYVARDYAPIDVRARAVIGYAHSARKYLADAAVNLAGAAIPRPWLELSIMVIGGSIDFVDKDVRELFFHRDPVADPKLAHELDVALGELAADLRTFREFLVGRRGAASAEFALGAELYVKGLADIEDLEVDLATLERAAADATARDLAALAEAAREIDAKKSVAEVVAEVTADVPSPDEVLALAGRQAEEARGFLETHPIVSIPSNDVAEVRLSPPFMRFNPAFLNAPGMFEEKPLPSFYYISPPDPSWPPEQQRTYLQPRNVLLFTTVHELWPGHFLQHLYRRKLASKVLKSFCSYADTEGWALYVEQVMWDAGFGARDPRVHIGQLLSSLMRDVRFLVALGLHTKGMTVEQATALFQEKAFMSLSAARQQAMRGTADPYYSSYTLGKLMIERLRDDWKAKLEAEGKGTTYSLQAFHEAFLSQGCQAVPIIREALVGGGKSL